jgi:membrane fusion protein (multidrug efflux system)
LKFVKQHPIVIIAVLAVLSLIAMTAKTWLDNQQLNARVDRGSGGTLVETSAAFKAEIVEEIEAIGTAQANESVMLTSKVTDTVRKINFDDGDFVEQDDILVELTNSEETAQLAEAQATADEASRQYSRVKNLINQKLASETELDTEKVRMQTAQARLDGILARLNDRLIRAPFSGTLGFRNISKGSLVTPSTTVTTLDDISVIKLDFSIPESFLATLRQGQQIVAGSVAYPGMEFTGVVTTINSRVNPVTRAVIVRALLKNEERQLRPGMLLTVKLELSRGKVLVIPEQAVVPIQDRQYVFTIDDDGIAQRREITVGRRRTGIVEILGGVTDGEAVITAGVIKINTGSKVIDKNAAARDGTRR